MQKKERNSNIEALCIYDVFNHIVTFFSTGL